MCASLRFTSLLANRNPLLQADRKSAGGGGEGPPHSGPDDRQQEVPQPLPGADLR